jgi:hypothetical protein
VEFQPSFRGGRVFPCTQISTIFGEWLGPSPAFASGDVVDVADATDIRSITERHSLSPSSVIRTAIGASCDALSPCGERCGLTLFRWNDAIG